MALPRHVLKELAERRCHVRVPRVVSAEERLRVRRTLSGLWTLGALGGAIAAPLPRHHATR